MSDDAAARMRDFLDAYDKLGIRHNDILFAVPNSDARLLVSDLRLLSAEDEASPEDIGFGEEGDVEDRLGADIIAFWPFDFTTSEEMHDASIVACAVAERLAERVSYRCEAS